MHSQLRQTAWLLCHFIGSLLSYHFRSGGYCSPENLHRFSTRKNAYLRSSVIYVGRLLARNLSIGHRLRLNRSHKSSGLFPTLRTLLVTYLVSCSPGNAASLPDKLDTAHMKPASHSDHMDPLDLDCAQDSITQIPINTSASFHLIYHDHHAVLFSSQVEDSKHIVAISKLIDYGTLAQSNSNARYTARYPTLVLDWETPDCFVRLGKDKLYYISDTTMSHGECHLDCASKQASMLHRKEDLLTLVKNKPGRFQEVSVWINTHSTYHGKLSNSYRLYLDNSVEIYPAPFSNASTIHFYRYQPESNQMVRIKDIAHRYTYYDGNSGSYWAQHKYSLLVTVDASLHFQAMVPVPSNTVTPLAYKARCSCVKNLSATDTAYNRLLTDIEIYNHTLTHYNLTVPFLRLRSPITKVAEVATLLFDDDSLHDYQQQGLDRLINASDILNLTISNVTKSELYNGLAYFAFKSIFGPLILSKASDELLKLAQKPHTVQIPWSSINHFKQQPLSEDMSFYESNGNWVLNYTGNTLESPLRWSIEDFNRNVNILTDRNKIFIRFIEYQAAYILAQQLQEKIPYDIDFSHPVTVRRDIKSSFSLFTFYFMCHSSATSTTLYNVAPLPLLYTDHTFHMIETPAQVTTSTRHHGYQVLGDTKQARFLDDCLDAVFSGAPMLPICPITKYSGDLIHKLFTVTNINFFYVGTIQAILHVNCPSLPLFIAHLRQDAMLVMADPRCTLTLKTNDGSIHHKALPNNDSDTRSMIHPRILVTYNYHRLWSSNDIHRIISYSVAGGVFVLILILIAVFVVIYKWKKRRSMYFPQSCTFRRSSSPVPSLFNRTI